MTYRFSVNGIPFQVLPPLGGWRSVLAFVEGAWRRIASSPNESSARGGWHRVVMQGQYVGTRQSLDDAIQLAFDEAEER